MWLLIKNRVEGQVEHPGGRLPKSAATKRSPQNPRYQKKKKKGLYSQLCVRSRTNLLHEDVSWKS